MNSCHGPGAPSLSRKPHDDICGLQTTLTFVQSLDRIRRADRFPLALGEAREGEQLVARVLQAISDGLALQAPLADERLALRLDLLLRADVDHILVIGGKFVMQSIGSVSEKVAMLMYRAALNREVGPQCGKACLRPPRDAQRCRWWLCRILLVRCRCALLRRAERVRWSV